MSSGFKITGVVKCARIYARQEQIGGNKLTFRSPWPISNEMINEWVVRALREELSPNDDVIAVTMNNELVRCIKPKESDEQAT